MTQADLKASIAKGIDDFINQLVRQFVVNLETQQQQIAVKEFSTGLKYALLAEDLALKVAGEIKS